MHQEDDDQEEDDDDDEDSDDDVVMCVPSEEHLDLITFYHADSNS